MKQPLTKVKFLHYLLVMCWSLYKIQKLEHWYNNNMILKGNMDFWWPAENPSVIVVNPDTKQRADNYDNYIKFHIARHVITIIATS